MPESPGGRPPARLDSRGVAELKPAYLFHGEDHGRIAERRASLRALAERLSGAQGVEILEGDSASVDAVAATLSAMTFAIGRRFVIVDGVERWKDGELEPMVSALGHLDPDTTAAFFAREDGRLKAPAALAQAVQAAGGDVRVEATVKPWELPKWVQARGAELGLDVSSAAAKALVGLAGERQQRLLRELEKLALGLPGGSRVEVEEVEEVVAGSAERRAWALADALLARDASSAMRCYLELRAQGERLTGLLFLMTRRLRVGLDAVTRLEAGEAAAQVKRSLRMPPRAADRLLADAQRSDAAALRKAIEVLADLELASRGGAAGALGEDTLALTAIRRIAA